MKKTVFILIMTLVLPGWVVTQTHHNLIPAKDQKGDMLLIPGGSFQMGISRDDLEGIVKMGHKVPKMEMNAEWWYADEIPIHTVAVAPFYMDVHEVTNQEFGQFTLETGYKAQGDWKKYCCGARVNHPVVNVTWEDAKAYAVWAGKRLPTEEEWEYAARGGLDVKWFPWGNEPDDGSHANYDYNGEGFWEGTWKLLFGKIHTKPVESYPPNGYGLYDMCGNVSEWTSSVHKPYPGGPKEDWIYAKRGPYTKNPKPIYGKVVRGGSWESCNPVFVRLNNRSGRDPESHSWNLGFRCVADSKK